MTLGTSNVQMPFMKKKKQYQFAEILLLTNIYLLLNGFRLKNISTSFHDRHLQNILNMFIIPSTIQ